MTELRAKLGTFEGVFVPTLLTIAGVILYTRTTWLVGTLGLARGLLVILAAYAVAFATALSICSLATNVQVGAGGAFSLLAKTLGIEAGGSISTALYLSQSLAAVLYIFGFREGWLRIFPGHQAWAVDSLVLVVVSALAWTSARLAFRAQYLILGLVGLSMLSVGGGFFQHSLVSEIPWTVVQGKVGLFQGLAVFFPAVTGILAGVNLAGELKTPKASIKIGLFSALGVSLLLYLLVALAGALLLEGERRVGTTALVEIGYWKWAVLGGLLSATFSSALNCVVGAPRILQALAEHRVVPRGRWLAKLADDGEPRRCLSVTIVFVGAGLLLRDLNAVAPLITLFFLLTYGSLNLALAIQQGFRLPHFRPLFRVPLLVPLAGALGCLAAMWFVSPTFFFVSGVVIVILYWWLENRSPRGPFGQVRAGLTVGFLHRVLCRLAEVPDRNAWHTHAVVLVERPAEGSLLAVGRTLAQKGGSITFLCDREEVGQKLQQAVTELRRDNLLARYSDFKPGSRDTILVALKGMANTLVPPNLLLHPLPVPSDREQNLIDEVHSLKMGLWFYRFSEFEHDQKRPWDKLYIWLSGYDEEAPGLGLVLLQAWRLQRLYRLQVFLHLVGAEPTEGAKVLTRLKARARFDKCEEKILEESLSEALEQVAPKTLNFIVGSRTDELASLGTLQAHEADFVVAVLSGEATAE